MKNKETYFLKRNNRMKPAQIFKYKQLQNEPTKTQLIKFIVKKIFEFPIL